MKVSVIGCGYLGAVHSAALARLGHDVVGIDVDAGKVQALAAGRPSFFEPGLPELLAAGAEAGTLHYSTNIADAAGCAVHFITVGTPQQPNGYAADLRYVHAAVAALIPHLRPGDVVAGKSTVPVGTARQIAATLSTGAAGSLLVWNPEFLREGHAVQDTLSPDRLVYGLPGPAGCDGLGAADGQVPHPQRVLDEVYRQLLADGCPRLVMDYETAEMVKVSANAFLATKISFINAISDVCEAAGADVAMLADAIGYDARIGRSFLNAGLGFGGGCLPKDIRAFMARAGELGASQAQALLREVDAINAGRRSRMVDLASEVCGGSLAGQRVAVLGLAFKPQSDDVRESPAISVAAELQDKGAIVTATDPQAVRNAALILPALNCVETVEEAVQGSHAVLVLTDWDEYRSLDPTWLAGLVSGMAVVDGRSCLDADAWRAAGWTYRALGRPGLPAAVPATV
ncbi:UDP-glucose/GDP-mannose dehydrogenase family protein [Pseudarthrobacter sp. CC4]|uniref:UDP-glucose dehydrogenase family protein n=1 Tax=Pseudarthrobacter sp. CC4 TaxID=3029190 RepID=UPI003B8CF1CF